VKAIFAGLFLWMSATSSAAAANSPRYSCTFENGAAWNYDKGQFQDDTNAPLSFEISHISRKAQTAELTTETGRTDLKLVAAIGAMHFIEVTLAGYLSLTTLYGEGDRLPAVHSRHLGIVGQPIGGQLTGFCIRKGS